MAEPLSVIVIQLDSLNRHFLRTYGNDWVKTPTLDDFAARAAVFEHHYTGSLPCMPARREIWAGNQEFWWRGWGPLEPWDRPLAYQARQAKQPIVTHLVTDQYHFFEWGSHNYNYDFHGYDFIRGHEFDNWRTDDPLVIPDWASVLHTRRPEAMIYLRNVQDFGAEADFFGPRVMQAAAEWLDRNHAQPQFYLHLDSFDVHEPFHIPEPYRSLYTHDDYRRYSPWPHYGRVDAGPSALPAKEVAWVRAQFAGKLAMVDRWLARVFERLDRYRLWERTAVLVTTDHGHYLGDHGWMGKPAAPLYHTLCHIPLLAWLPGGAHNGRRVSAVTQTVDLYATVLDLLGQPVPAVEHVHSRSFAPVLRGEAPAHRGYAVYGLHAKRIGLTAGEWTLLRYQDADAAPAAHYTHHAQQVGDFGFTHRQKRRFAFPELEAGRFIPGVDMPVWRGPLPFDWARTQPEPRADLLFHNPSDPGQENNRAAERPDVIAHLEDLLRAHTRELLAPEEQIRRLHL